MTTLSAVLANTCIWHQLNTAVCKGIAKGFPHIIVQIYLNQIRPLNHYVGGNFDSKTTYSQALQLALIAEMNAEADYHGKHPLWHLFAPQSPLIHMPMISHSLTVFCKDVLPFVER